MKLERARFPCDFHTIGACALNKNYIIFNNYVLTQIKSIRLVLFALGTLESLLLVGETPMAREKLKNKHTECKGSDTLLKK